MMLNARFITPLLPLLLLATPAVAAPPVEAAFGNTVVSTFPDGRTQKLWLAKDGTYRAKGRNGKDSTGRWSIKAEKLCLKQATPFPAPIVYCTFIPQDAPSVTWTAKAVNGDLVKLKVVRGMNF